MNPARDFALMVITNRLPARYRPEESEPFPPSLIGATIIRLGSPTDSQLIEGGGLVVDYRPAGSSEVHRLVLSLTELGAEVVYQGPCAMPPTPV